MPRFEQIRDRLPTLYRPEENDTGLLTLFLKAMADVLEKVNSGASDVLQSHWFSYADRALFSQYFTRCRQLQGLVSIRAGDLLDIKDPAHLAAELKGPTQPLSEYLVDKFSSDTKQLLAQYDQHSAFVPEPLQRALMDEINRIIKEENLYDEQRFSHITLSEETQKLIEQEPTGNELIRLNLLLLEQAYSGEVAKGQLDFPYIHDLARLGAILPISPWQEPLHLRESVEAYRVRIGRIASVYRNGLGTLGALRSMVEAQLPIDLKKIPELQDHPFWIEEFIPLTRDSFPVQARGEPVEMVGPLMRWSITNKGIKPASTTLYIDGVEPQTGLIDATQNPLIELYQAQNRFTRLGIAYKGIIPSGKVLRLRPAYSSWIGLNTGIQRSEAVPLEGSCADPTAPGPWQSVEEAPGTQVVAILQTHDHTLWLATGGSLYRYNGQEWIETVNGLGSINCLAEDKDNGCLLIGTGTHTQTIKGLFYMPLYPKTAGDYSATIVENCVKEPIYTLFEDIDGRWWLGSEAGLFQLTGEQLADGTVDYTASGFVLGEDEDTSTKVYSISQDKSGTLYFGTDLGLFQYQGGTNHWYWYSGKERTEQAKDWQQFDPSKEGEERNFPTQAEVFLPPVRCVYRGGDMSLWIGTDNGIARYIARCVRGLTYETVLEAFPDLTQAEVFEIKEDEAGLVWFCTDRGLLRYDGRHWWQFRAGEWVQMGRADSLYNGTPKPRGTWRFDRTSSKWQHFNNKIFDWEDFPDVPRTTQEASVRTIIWTDQLVADIGQWEGTKFNSSTPVEKKDFLMRYKPSERFIIEGGIPAVPRLPVGTSVWRYLSLEPAELEEPTDLPAWTIEGRLIDSADIPAPGPGRFDTEEPPPPSSNFDEAVFAFNPSAKVKFEWHTSNTATVLVRLKKRSNSEHIDPAIIDRVWQGIQQVRPAGIKTVLAVEENIIRGGENG